MSRSEAALAVAILIALGGSLSPGFAQENSPPIASFSFSPLNAHAGETVTFDAANSSDPDGSIAYYEWDFDGDDVIDASGVRVSHKFPIAGQYAVKLLVIDNRGLSTSTTIVLTVAKPAKNPWDYFWLEGLAGTLGAAGGGIVGVLLGSLFCLPGDSVLCITGLIGGFVTGALFVPIIAVSAVGGANGIRGNIVMAFLMEVGGLVCGAVLDMHSPIPLLTSVGAGFGAAVGYNIGAKVVSQGQISKYGEITLASITIWW